MARLSSSTALLTGEPLTLAYYRDRALTLWVKDLAARRPISGVLAFSSSMGQYAGSTLLGHGAVTIMDFCDVDSDKWAQYASSHSFPLNRVYAREARALAAVESRYVREFDASLVVSEAEARILRAVAGCDPARVRVVPNGVDTGYFDPELSFTNPFSQGTRPIVFTGAMDYHANVDGVQWYAREVFPIVRQQLPGAVFAIVGSDPAPAVRALARAPGVTVTGRVPDIRPYLAHASVVVAPLRIARGVQNKVLEALAMARPVVACENALQGISAVAEEAGVAVANDPHALATATVACAGVSSEPRSRAFVQTRFSWEKHLAAVTSLMENSSAAIRSGTAHNSKVA
jgi:sugar transferase (PEP-CTERM/EpsH1 system associated)